MATLDQIEARLQSAGWLDAERRWALRLLPPALRTYYVYASSVVWTTDRENGRIERYGTELVLGGPPSRTQGAR